MTPTRVSASVVVSRIAWIDAMLAGIRALSLDSIGAFDADPRTSAAAESYVRRALEALLDLGRHVLAKAFGQPAAEYRDIPRYLAEHGVIDEADAVRWLKMAGYRNRMVHFYSEVSRTELFDICATKLGDVEAAVAAVRAWMASHPELVDTSL
jgi:uncharacterized protein YutE (UPF0331/DUF86 family)